MGCCISDSKTDGELTSFDDDDENTITDPSGIENSTFQTSSYYGSCSHVRPSPIASPPIWYWWQGNKNRTNPNGQKCISQLALAMYHTELTAAAIVGVPLQTYLTPTMSEHLVRKAKREGSTVTLREGHLYIDYKYIGRVPPNMGITN